MTHKAIKVDCIAASHHHTEVGYKCLGLNMLWRLMQVIWKSGLNVHYPHCPHTPTLASLSQPHRLLPMITRPRKRRLRPDYRSVQFSSVAHSCPTLREPLDCSTPGLPVHHQFPGLTQSHVRWVGDAIQPSHPLSSPSPFFNLPQHQSLFKWVSPSHQVAKVSEFQL